MATSTPPNKYQANYRSFFRDFPNFNIKLTQHARNRMKERDIQLPQIRTVLMTGSVVQVESDIRTGLDKHRVSGRDADGRGLEVVANLNEGGPGRVVIVTAIDTPDASGRRSEEIRRSGRRPIRRGKGDRATEANDDAFSDPP